MGTVGAVVSVIVVALLDRFTTFSGFDPASIGRAIFDGMVPYRDFGVEYPPGGVAILTVPVVAGGAYWLVFHGMMTAAWILLAITLGRRKPGSVGGFLGCSLIYAFLVGAGFDIFIALLTFLAFRALESGRNETAAWWLGGGTVTKWVPVGLAPLVMAGASGRRRLVVAGITVLSLFIALGLPSLIARDGRDPISYHRGRLLHAESTLGTVILAERGLTGNGYGVVYEHRARGLSGVGPWASPVALGATLVFMAIVWRRGDPRSPSSWAAILLAIPAFGPVASPQFLIWPLGFAGLLPRSSRAFYAGAGAVSLVLFGSVIPFREGHLLTALMLVRNLLTVGAAVTAAREACKPFDGRRFGRSRENAAPVLARHVDPSLA